MPELSMPPASVGHPQDGGAGDGRPTIGAVRGGVLAALGRPPDLYLVDVRPLWGRRHRVNVLLGPDTASTRIAHGYCMETGECGAVLSATPRIARLYA